MRRIEEVLTPLTSELNARAANATAGNADIRSGEFATDRFESAVNRPAAHVAPNVNMPMLDDLDVEEAAVVYLKTVSRALLLIGGISHLVGGHLSSTEGPHRSVAKCDSK